MLSILRPDGDLEGTSAGHLVQRSLVVGELEHVGTEVHQRWSDKVSGEGGLHHAVSPDLSAVEQVDSSRETIGLREGTDDSDLIDEDLGG